MGGRSILLLGGARSGKSRLSLELAEELGDKVLFVATAAALDEEMSARIQVHKQQRPASWRTLESPVGVGPGTVAALGDAEVVIIDCITLLISNLILRGQAEEGTDPEEIDYDRAEAVVDEEIEGIIDCIEQSDASFIIVSNEVGMGVVPVYKSARVYRDLLGKANQMLARRVDEVLLLVAGIPWRLKEASLPPPPHPPRPPTT